MIRLDKYNLFYSVQILIVFCMRYFECYEIISTHFSAYENVDLSVTVQLTNFILLKAFTLE